MPSPEPQAVRRTGVPHSRKIAFVLGALSMLFLVNAAKFVVEMVA